MCASPDVNSQKPWWQRVGFQWYPFEKLDAAQEEHFEEYFVKPPCFSELKRRHHSVLYAPLGGGKTAARIMLECMCTRGDEIKAILCVTCDDFSRVLQKAEHNPTRVTSEMLIEEVMRRASKLLFNYWLENSERIAQVPWYHQQWVAQYLDGAEWNECVTEALCKIGLVLSSEEFATKVKEGRLEEVLDRVAEDFHPRLRILASLLQLRERERQERTASEWLKVLCETAVSSGFEAVFILFDKVDGLNETSKPEGCAALLQPLLNSLALLSIKDIFFKLFLPIETQGLLAQMAGIRSLRITPRTLEWPKEQLRELLKERLRAASGKEIESLDAICVETLIGRIDEELVQCAKTPRHLLKLGHKLFEAHDELSPEVPLITVQDLEAVLRKEKEKRKSKAWKQRWRLCIRLIGFLCFAMFLSSFLLTWLPPLLPYARTQTQNIPDTSMALFSSHPHWGVLGGEGELRVTVDGVSEPVEIYLDFDPFDAVESPKGRALQWDASNSGQTQTLRIRYMKTGWIRYSITVKTNKSINGSALLIMPLPAPLANKLVSSIGALAGALLTGLPKQISLLIKDLLERRRTHASTCSENKALC